MYFPKFFVLVVPLFMYALNAEATPKCPEGLEYVGSAYRDSSAVNKEAKVPPTSILVALPKNFPLDANYRQNGGTWAGGDATSKMKDSDVPNGIHILTSGTEGGEKGWSVDNIRRRIIEEDGERIIQRGYDIQLYCHSGSGLTSTIGHVSCNVRADFCAKRRQH